MTKWTPQDEINLQNWAKEKGFEIVYIPQTNEWGWRHKYTPNQIFAGFKQLSDLKQYFVNLKGEKKDVRTVSEGDFHEKVEKALRVQKLH